DDGHAGLACDALCLELVPARAQGIGRGADEYERGSVHGLCEVGILREEAVAGMDRVRARLLRGADVLLGEGVPPDLHGLVRIARVQRAGVVRRDDRDSRDPERAARTEHAQGDLAAVCYEELLDLHSATRVSA